MSKRPQFSLKAILVIIAVLAVPLGMLVSGEYDLVAGGAILAIPALFGSMGYLLRGRDGAAIGVLTAIVAMCLIWWVVVLFQVGFGF